MSIKSFAIYGIGKFIPDDLYVNLYYYKTFHKIPDLKNPKTFNEKLTWMKLYDKNPQYTQMVDKYAAKGYVEKIIGGGHTIPTFKVWDSPDDVDVEELPEKFVLKCTHDCGSIVICRDKSKFDLEAAKEKLRVHYNRNYFWMVREWPYKNVKPRIIAEEYMEDAEETQAGLTDYKFYCFGGIPKYLYVSTGLENHSTARISFLTLDWQFAPFGRSDYRPFEELPKKPENLLLMVEIAQKLSRRFPFLRVDLYEIKGKVYFSELTLFPCGGMMPFSPKEWDERLGLELELPHNSRNNVS